MKHTPTHENWVGVFLFKNPTKTTNCVKGKTELLNIVKTVNFYS